MDIANTSYGLSEYPWFPERDRTGVGGRTVRKLQQRSAHQGENRNDEGEGEAKMRRHGSSGGGAWFGDCIVHIRRASYLNVGSAGGWHVGYYNGGGRRVDDYIWLAARCFTGGYFIVGW